MRAAFMRRDLRAAVLLLGGLAACGTGPARGAHLELEEAWAFALPDTLALRGVALRTPGEAVGWGPHDERGVVLVGANGTARRVATEAVRSPVAAAFPADGCPIEAIDGDGPALVCLAHDGRVVSRTPVALPERPVAAWRDRAGWWVGTWRARGRLCVDRLTVAGARADSVCLSRSHFPDADVALSGADGRLVVSRLAAPFTFVVIQDGRIVLTTRPPASVLDRLAAETGRYAGAPAGVLPLGDGYLQGIVDRRSPRRSWNLYDREGAFVRERAFEAALTPLRASPDDAELLVVRRGRALAVVGYRYRWSE